MNGSQNTPFHEPGNATQGFKATKDRFPFIHERFESMGFSGRFMAPMCVQLLEVKAPHEPKGRAGCPHPAAEQAGHSGRSRRGEDTQPYLPLAVQGFKARIVSENSHLDPLPSSDVGRGNPKTTVSRTSAWVTERDRIFPLPFARGEDQGEGLIRRPFVSLTKWQGALALSRKEWEPQVAVAGRITNW